MKNQILNLRLILLTGSLSVPGSGFAADTSSEVPRQVMALVGSYSGSWKSFGIDAQGQVVQRSAWTDTMKAEKPVREAERAWVSTEDVMVFEGRAGAPFKLPGKEGFRLNTDGTLGEYFIETFGQTYRMQKLAQDIWTYATDASAQELSQLGFPIGVPGRMKNVRVEHPENGLQGRSARRPLRVFETVPLPEKLRLMPSEIQQTVLTGGPVKKGLYPCLPFLIQPL